MRRQLILYLLSALAGIVGGLITIAVVALVDLILELIWQEGVGISIDDPTRTIYIIPIFVAAGLIVGLINRASKKPLAHFEEILEEVFTKGHINWRTTPRAILTGLISLASGASLGPEALAASTSAGADGFSAEKSKANPQTSQVLSLGGISGMMGSLLSSPFLVPAMIIEGTGRVYSQIKSMISYSLVASAFGIGTFFTLFNKLYVIDLGLPSYSGSNLEDLTKAFIFGAVGALLGAVTFFALNKIFEKTWRPLKVGPLPAGLIGGLAIGLVAFAVPLTMFSGQHTLPELVAQSATLGFAALLGIAFLKLASTAFLLETGFFGGPVFPAIFAATALGIAMNDILKAPINLAVAASMAGLIAIVLRQPLSAALLPIAVTGTVTAGAVAVAVAGAFPVLILINRLTKNAST